MAALQRICICKMTPASRSARGIVLTLTVSEPGRRVYQSRGFVCKQMHVPSRQTKLIPTMRRFPPPAWRYQSVRRASDKKPNSVGARDKRGRLHLKVLLLISFQFYLLFLFLVSRNFIVFALCLTLSLIHI